MPRIHFLVVVIAFGFGVQAFGADNTAPVFRSCGRYEIQGTVKNVGKELFLIVFSGTQSETKLKIGPDPSLKVFGFVGHKARITGTIKTKLKYFQGSIGFEKIERAVPNLLDPGQGDGFWLLKKSDCLD